MKTSLKILLVAGLLSGGAVAGSVPALSQSVGFSVRLGDVAIAYDDGYYDRGHHWHRWRHSRDRDWYRVHYAHRYHAFRHDRDRDGVPNRFDRDRDNDGVPNYRDRRPNNPYRR